MPMSATATSSRDLARGRHQQREAVGRRLRDGCGSDHAAGAGTVLDDNGLSERRLHRLGEEPRHDVHPAARGIADEDADRPLRIAVLRPHRACAGDESEARGGQHIPSGGHARLLYQQATVTRMRRERNLPGQRQKRWVRHMRQCSETLRTEWIVAPFRQV
jgi:hypothetical protein